MCGISGEVSYNGRLNQEVIGSMSATMAQRGPDDEGVWMSDHAALGHRRLAVIDPELGQQPMTRETSLGSVALTYVGEVYNYRELRRELQARGHYFRTESDTEVILNGYLEWGEGVAEKMRGMYGLAIWDGREDKLMLLRDRLGVKPLCYYPTPDGVIFGSEPKAILAHSSVKRSVDASGWREHFAHVKSPGHLIWNGMQEVTPGGLVTVTPAGIKERTYWRLQSYEHPDDPAATVETVRGLLEEIVDEQLVADVPVGMLLSGGLDSSAITALAARSRANLGQKLDSYTVDFTTHAGQLNNNVIQTGLDAPFAQEVSEMLGTNHTRFVIDSIDLAAKQLRRRVLQARDMAPGTGDTYASRLLLFEHLKKQSTVALSGEMADELFGGYPIFFDQKVLKDDGWPWYLYGPTAHTTRLAGLNPEFRDALDLDTYLSDTYTDAIRPIERVKGESVQDYRMRQINYLEITRHSGFLLDFTDRLSGAAGLEIRAPYCDHRLVEYVYNVPWYIKSSGGRVKGLLKDAVGDLLPSSVVERPKSGYPWTPDAEYLQAIQLQARELASQPSHPIFDIISREWLNAAVSKPVDRLTISDRDGITQALELDIWQQLYNPKMV